MRNSLSPLVGRNSEECEMGTARKLPIGYYVYIISVDEIIRYIGKGKGSADILPHERG
jgi:hypothetical protein